MALINPVHGLVVPFLCVFTIPLAFFAGLTTVLAFSVLMFRVAVVYLDIALAMVPQYFMGRKPGSRIRSGSGSPTRYRIQGTMMGSKTPVSPSSSSGSGSGHITPSSTLPPFPTAVYNTGGSVSYKSPSGRRKSSYGSGGNFLRHSRGSSQVSMASLGTITPIQEDEVVPPSPGRTNESVLAPSVGMDRDFEGVGGWNLDAGDESSWTNINSRLQLPSERVSFTRHHQRSQSLGPVSPGDGSWLALKPREGLMGADGRPDWDKIGYSGSAARTSSALSPGSTGRHRTMTGMTTLDPDSGYFGSFMARGGMKKTVV